MSRTVHDLERWVLLLRLRGWIKALATTAALQTTVGTLALAAPSTHTLSVSMLSAAGATAFACALVTLSYRRARGKNVAPQS